MFSEAKARRVTQFIECLKHTKGEFHGEPFKLLPWQEKIIRDVFGIVDERGNRQFRTAYVEIGKKNGKSELGAALALNMLINDDEWKAEVYSCASDRQQAAIVFDVAVDLRSDSATYGKWYGVALSAENKKQFLIPEGFAHGFLVLSDEAEFCYKVNDFWHPNDEGGLAWNDQKIGIRWPDVTGEYRGTPSAEGYCMADGTPLTLSEKDQEWPGLEKK